MRFSFFPLILSSVPPSKAGWGSLSYTKNGLPFPAPFAMPLFLFSLLPFPGLHGKAPFCDLFPGFKASPTRSVPSPSSMANRCGKFFLLPSSTPILFFHRFPVLWAKNFCKGPSFAGYCVFFFPPLSEIIARSLLPSPLSFHLIGGVFFLAGIFLQQCRPFFFFLLFFQN